MQITEGAYTAGGKKADAIILEKVYGKTEGR